MPFFTTSEYHSFLVRSFNRSVNTLQERADLNDECGAKWAPLYRQEGDGQASSMVICQVWSPTAEPEADRDCDGSERNSAARVKFRSCSSPSVKASSRHQIPINAPSYIGSTRKIEALSDELGYSLQLSHTETSMVLALALVLFHARHAAAAESKILPEWLSRGTTAFTIV